MDAVKQRNRVVGLVRLQLADEVQLDIRIGCAQFRPFGRRLLHPVLAKMPMACLEQRTDFVRAPGLGNRDQGNVIRRSLRNLAGLGHFGSDIGQPLGRIFWSRISHGRAL